MAADAKNRATQTTPGVVLNEETPILNGTITAIFDNIVDLSKRKRAGRPSAKRDREELILRLKENESFVLKTILAANFNDKVQFPFPEGEPLFKPNTTVVKVTDRIISVMGQLIVQAKGSKLQKEAAFISLLETVNIADAQLICVVKDKKLEELYPKITKDIVKEVWPNIL